MISLAGKGVVVTGSGRGLGRAYAEAAAARGAAVVVNDVDLPEAEAVAEGIRRRGGIAVTSAHSVSDSDQAAELIALCLREFGSIHGLVNNAGIYPHDVTAWENRADVVRAMFDVNVLGAIFCTTSAVQAMKAQGHGTIVNVSSGTQLGVAGNAIYGATKGAITTLTYTWALDLLPFGIRVNAVSPIAVTRMKRAPGPEHVDPDEIAPLVVYLLSDEAGAMTGQVIRLTGKELGVMKHPRVGTMLTRDTWSPEDIAAEFTGVLGGQLEPIGRERVLSPAVGRA
jgi:NAD(P)-dependent dehydrogenase (short-subunit alcohol dehydrogenase family)